MTWLSLREINKRFGYDKGLIEGALHGGWDYGTEHQQQRHMGISSQRFRRVAVCDSTDKAVSERMKARAMNKRFGEAGGLVEGPMDDGWDYGTEHQQQRHMGISSQRFRRVAVCDSTDKAVSERMKARAMNKRFGEAGGLVEGPMDDGWDYGTEHQQQRHMGISSQRFRRVAVCDSTDKAVSERMKARAMNKRFGEAGGLVEGPMDDGWDYGTEHQQQSHMEISPQHFRRAAVCDSTDKAVSERMKARAMNKRF